MTAGEVTEAEALGAEAHASKITYRTQNRTALNPTAIQDWKVKQEPVFAINSKGNKPRGSCFHCGAKDHYVAQCPRKAAGLAPVINAIEDGDEHQDESVQYVRTRYPPQQNRKLFGTANAANPAKPAYRGGYRAGRGSASAPRGRKFNRRVAFIYENEEGQTIHEEIVDPDTTAAANSTHEEVGEAEHVEGINNLHLGDDHQEYDYSEGDYIPGAFLGI